MAKILIVEDEPQMQIGLRDNFEFEGYEVELVANGNDALEKISKEQYDLIIQDIMIPGISGLDVIKKAREKGIKSPFIILTAKSEEIDKVVGLEIGADDYITKPFSLRELLARVKAVLRRNEGNTVAAQTKINIGSVLIDFATYEVTKAGVPVSMTPKEVDILKHLWKNKNQVVSRDSLLTEVWGYDESISSRTVDNFILKLRQKIEEDPATPKHIITIHGTGYKFIP